jgi:hypothetical protein
MDANIARVSKPWLFIALTALLGLGLVSSDASANILLARANTNAQIDDVAPFPATYLDLDGAGGAQTSLTFSTTVANQLVRVILNAECSIGGAATNFLDTTIYVDPAGPLAAYTLTPTSGDNGFCSGNGTATHLDGYVSAVTQAFTQVPTAGVHSVRVLVLPVPGAPWRIDSLSIVIDSQ